MDPSVDTRWDGGYLALVGPLRLRMEIIILHLRQGQEQEAASSSSVSCSHPHPPSFPAHRATSSWDRDTLLCPLCSPFHFFLLDCPAPSRFLFIALIDISPIASLLLLRSPPILVVFSYLGHHGSRGSVFVPSGEEALDRSSNLDLDGSCWSRLHSPKAQADCHGFWAR
jgi:hypothetical protein